MLVFYFQRATTGPTAHLNEMQEGMNNKNVTRVSYKSLMELPKTGG